MPSSPCGPDCVDAPTEAGTLRVAARVLSFAAVLSTFPVAYLAAPRRWRPAVNRRYARTLLFCCGIRIRVIDNSAAGAAPADPGTGLLVVADHVGWTDIAVLAAVQPMGFVARADLIDWPLLGGIARMVRVLPIERESLRRLPGVVDQLAARLRSGDRVAIFPEGTTWCGRARGRLRPALFQAAVDTGTPVRPMHLRYRDRVGNLSTIPGFIGADTLSDSIRRVLRSRGVVAEVVLRPLEMPGTDRHDLARRCERALNDAHADQDFAAWPVHAREAGAGQLREEQPSVQPDQVLAPNAHPDRNAVFKGGSPHRRVVGAVRV
ncbi:1-acyl-sn-glycerol-3-phosphate acyltransferase [Nocardia uniformis]|uniref:1-acyl-sn-glycerol-3-phosphate acyltransferase n=2 Tax=Nocardia uniformis TaxID=53432 RepID=A0A849C1E0_9NOCA|nr:1-acyl-sn-glycerol-3-phosphate acyltransferase [Nocardia uniformis]